MHSMRIAHVALWTRDLEGLRAFYVDRLGGLAGTRYENPRTGFSSIFVSFGDGPPVELMSRLDVAPRESDGPRSGYAHVAFTLGSREAVDETVERLSRAGVPVVRAPRVTGDGHYEAVVSDPDGNVVELVA